METNNNNNIDILKAEIDKALRAKIEADSDVTVLSLDGIYMGITVEQIIDFCTSQIRKHSTLPKLNEISNHGINNEGNNMTNGIEIAKLFNKDTMGGIMDELAEEMLANIVDLALKEAFECGQNEAIKLAQKIADRK